MPYFERPFVVIQLSQGLFACLKQALLVISFFRDTKLIRHSSWSHPFNEWPFFYYKILVEVTHYFQFTMYFREQEFQEGDIIVTKYDISLDSSMYILKFSLLFDYFSCSHSFFLWHYHYFTGALEAQLQSVMLFNQTQKSLRNAFVYHFFFYICLHALTTQHKLVVQVISQGQVQSSHRRSITKAVLRYLSTFTGRDLC